MKRQVELAIFDVHFEVKHLNEITKSRRNILMLQTNWFILVVLLQVILVTFNSLLQISSHTTVVNMNIFSRLFLVVIILKRFYKVKA